MGEFHTGDYWDVGNQEKRRIKNDSWVSGQATGWMGALLMSLWDIEKVAGLGPQFRSSRF